MSSTSAARPRCRSRPAAAAEHLVRCIRHAEIAALQPAGCTRRRRHERGAGIAAQTQAGPDRWRRVTSRARFQVSRGPAAAPSARCARSTASSLVDPAGRGGGAGRRVRAAARPRWRACCWACCAPSAGEIRIGGQADRARSSRRADRARWCSPCSRTPIPRSIRASRSAPSSPCRCACRATPEPETWRAARRGHDGARRPRAPALRQLPEPALGRPAPARRHRPRAHQRAAPGDLRRADLGARRVGAVADPQPAAGPAPRPGPHLPADQPQPRRRRAHGDARRRHVSRPHRRGGGDGHASSARPSIPTARRCWPPC